MSRLALYLRKSLFKAGDAGEEGLALVRMRQEARAKRAASQPVKVPKSRFTGVSSDDVEIKEGPTRAAYGLRKQHQHHRAKGKRSTGAAPSREEAEATQSIQSYKPYKCKNCDRQVHPPKQELADILGRGAYRLERDEGAKHLGIKMSEGEPHHVFEHKPKVETVAGSGEFKPLEHGDLKVEHAHKKLCPTCAKPVRMEVSRASAGTPERAVAAAHANLKEGAKVGKSLDILVAMLEGCYSVGRSINKSVKTRKSTKLFLSV